MKLRFAAALSAAVLCSSSFANAQATEAQTVQTAEPMPVAAAAPSPASPRTATISAGLSIPLAVTSEISSSRNREGETFGMMVVQDVISDGIVVIPRGTRGVGEITLRSGRGVFGRSGKMELSFRYLDLDGVRIPLEGTHFQAGEGNTAGTIGAVVAAGVVGGLVVTGRSANVPEGREFTARTLDALPVIVLEPAVGSFDRPRARLAPTYAPSAIRTGSAHRMAEAARRRSSRSEAPAGETCEQRGRRLAPGVPTVARDIEARCERESRR